MFSVHTTLEEFKNVGFVFEENLVMEFTQLS